MAMFKSWSIKKYGYKLHRQLIKRYGLQHYFTIQEVRSTVYQGNFNPKYLPLGYLFYISPDQLTVIMEREFPEINIHQYKAKMMPYFHSNKTIEPLQHQDNI